MYYRIIIIYLCSLILDDGSPIEDFQTKVKDAGIEDLVFYLNHGETYTFELNR